MHVVTLSKLTASARGLYRVIVSNPAGSVTSSVVNVGVLLPQSISFGALPSLKYGDTATINATASSGLPVTLKVSFTDTCVEPFHSVTKLGIAVTVKIGRAHV